MTIQKIKKPLILVSNDDGVYAKGLQALIEVVRPFGEVVVVAPEKGESGMSHAISINVPLRVRKVKEEKDLIIYSTTGTPVDCVKLAVNQLLDRAPDIIVSGINHGSNASISVIYSGTMGAAVEGCLNCIPSIGFSLLNHAPNADFEMSKVFVKQIFLNALENGIPANTCLNVNFPNIPLNQVKGVKVCRMARGVWKEEYDKRTDPHKRDYFWLTGSFKNFEPDETDTDEWALENNYVAIVPIHSDFTNYNALDKLKKTNYEI